MKEMDAESTVKCDLITGCSLVGCRARESERKKERERERVRVREREIHPCDVKSLNSLQLPLLSYYVQNAHFDDLPVCPQSE